MEALDESWGAREFWSWEIELLKPHDWGLGDWGRTALFETTTNDIKTNKIKQMYTKAGLVRIYYSGRIFASFLVDLIQTIDDK